jgi:spore germination protein
MRYLATFCFAVAAFFCAFPAPLDAAMYRDFEISGWIPYWRVATGTADVMPHLDALTEVNPFVYTLKSDGTFLDNGSLDGAEWSTLRAAAKDKKVRFIPTIMTADGDLVHRLLSNTQSRIALEDYIAALVKEKGFDGIDIDFEGKKAETKDYFSTFLKGLSMRLGDKWLVCSIESRTPLADRYHGFDIPADAEKYANDLVAIGTYCDRVRIMAYDQYQIDAKIGARYEKEGKMYAPVADPEWVEKAIREAMKSIPARKIVIGVPTYGYEWQVRAYAGPEYLYSKKWVFNPRYATELAASLGLTPERSPWGEMHFTYLEGMGTSSEPVSYGAGSALVAAAAVSQHVDTTNTNATFRLVVWPDAESVRQKVALAQKLGVRGVAVFKFDGGQDPGIWKVLESGSSQKPPQTPSSSAHSFSRSLFLGSVGEDVRLLQKVLNSDTRTRVASGGVGSKGNETTRFGPATETAVKKFQLLYGLAKEGDPAYGFVGPKTRAKLAELINSI